MANIHVYFGIENLNLTIPQRNNLISGLQSLGVRNTSPQPAERNHWRVRLDNQAAIFEALFDEDTLTVNAIKTRLSLLFGVDVSLISHQVTTPTFASRASQLITFTYLVVDQLRFIAFGGLNATWQQSGDEVRAYLQANAAAWETL